MTKVLSIVHRVISSDYIKRAGLRAKFGAQTGALTLLQRFGWYGIPGALNLNFHMHVLYIDGAFNKRVVFYPVKPPTKQDLDTVTHKIAQRVARYLEQAGLSGQGCRV